MSTDIRIEFLTQRRSEIPAVGQRKRVRINGRTETKHVRRIEVEAGREYKEGLWYRGFYVLTDAAGMWG